MKIVLISPDFPPEISGVGDYTYFLSKALTKYGEVWVVTRSRNAQYYNNQDFNIYGGFNTFSLREYKKTIAFLKQIHPDVIYLQYTAYMYGWKQFELLPFLLLCKSEVQARLVLIAHEVWDPLFFSPLTFCRSILHRIKLPLLLIFVDEVFVTVPYRKKIVKRLFPLKPVFVTKVGSNIPYTNETGNTKFQISRNETVLSIFGSINWDRDYATIFKAIRTLPNVKLFIIGAPGNRKRYRELQLMVKRLGVSNKVVWTGYLSREEVSSLLQHTDIYVLPLIGGLSGRSTSFPTALEHSLPIITTKGKDTPTFLVDGENVLFVPETNSDALRECLIKLINSKELRIKIGNNAYQIFKFYYSWDAIAKELIEIDE